MGIDVPPGVPGSHHPGIPHHGARGVVGPEVFLCRRQEGELVAKLLRSNVRQRRLPCPWQDAPPWLPFSSSGNSSPAIMP